MRLKEAIRSYLGYEASVEAVNEEDLFRILLPIRWSLYGLTYNHLILDRNWKWKDFFLEYPDISGITASDNAALRVTITGEFIWWAEGKDSFGKWWPADRVPYKQIWKQGRSHRDVVQVPELDTGGFLVEPFKAAIWPAWNRRRRLKYRIEFGEGSTFRQLSNCKNGVLPIGQIDSRNSVPSGIPPKRSPNWNECWEAELRSSKVKLHGKL